MICIPSCFMATPLMTLGRNFHFLIAVSAARSKTLGGLDSTTLGLETVPSSFTVNLTLT